MVTHHIVQCDFAT
ncbi:hypothetical protein D030_0991A, partial [Vibrio parahaemolyticus AQ3810]